MDTIKLSIIIATYNSEKTIERALKSVQNLIMKDWECFVIDGLSKDKTIDIVKNYSLGDPRFKYISEKDTGIYDALNKGVKLAKGEWIYILGSDDELTKDGIDKLLSESEENDVVYGDVYLRNLNGSISTFFAKNHTSLRYVMNCSHQAVIVRKSVIEKLAGFNTIYKIRADFDLLQRAYLAGYRFKKVRAFVAYYMTTGYSSMASMGTHIERLRICQNNKSTRYPKILYFYQESKFVARLVLKKIGLS